ncbi:hypothetical protein ACHAQJ_008999 [Trichoderma viride]
MPPNHTEGRPFTEEEADAVLRGTLHGTFHNPQMPREILGAMSATSYASPSPYSYPAYAIGSPNLWTTDNSSQTSLFPYMVDETGEHLALSQYTDCKADAGIDQINGFVFVCDTGVEKLNSPNGRYLYKSCKKYGSGAQVNGIEIVYHGSVATMPAPPALPGRWEGVDMLNAEGKDVKGANKNQINGGRIRPMKRSDMGTTSGSASGC